MSTTTTPPVRPYFVPEGVDFDSLPESARAAIAAILDPAYQELVLAAPEGLEKSVGMTIVHLVWREILDQLELGQQPGATGGFTKPADRQKLIERHLRLVGAKVKATSLMLRLQEFRRKCGPPLAGLDPLSPPTEPWREVGDPVGQEV